MRPRIREEIGRGTPLEKSKGGTRNTGVSDRDW